MYGLQSDCYAKVWNKYERNYSTDLQISVSHKNKKDNQYVTDFSGFIKCVGDAKSKALTLEKGDVIKITSAIVITNSYNAQKGVSYTNYYIDNFEVQSGQAATEPGKANADIGFEIVEDEEPLPFS